MSRRVVASLIAVLTLIAFAGTVHAQQQNANQRSAFMEKHKYTFQLMQMVRHIGEIDKDKKYALTAAQASKVLAILKPLRAKPKLTQDQAKQTLKDLKNVFTAAQLNAMARIKPRFQQHRTPGQGGPPPGQRPGQGQRPPQGPQGQRRWDANAMKDFNPFYVKKGDKQSEERGKRWNELFAALEKKARSK